MADLQTIVEVVASIGVLVTCIYLLCYYFPLTEPKNHDLPLKIPIPVTNSSPATSPATNYRRFREKVGHEVYVSLKTYEKALEHLDEANLKVHEAERGLQEKDEYELCYQVNLELDRINFKFRHLVGDYYEK